MYTYKRVGNPEGRIGVSEVHGQEPGYTVYYVTSGSEEEQRRGVIGELQRIRSLKGSSTDFPTEGMSIKDLIEQYGDKDTIPIADHQVFRDKMEQVIDFLTGNTACTIMFFKENDSEWKHAGMFCSATDAIEDRKYYQGENNTVHVTNTINEDRYAFKKSEMTQRDIELIILFAPEHIDKWQAEIDLARIHQDLLSAEVEELIQERGDDGNGDGDGDGGELSAEVEELIWEGVERGDDDLETIIDFFKDQQECAILFYGHNSAAWGTAGIYCDAEELEDAWDNLAAAGVNYRLQSHDTELYSGYGGGIRFTVPEGGIPDRVIELLHSDPLAQQMLIDWYQEGVQIG